MKQLMETIKVCLEKGADCMLVTIVEQKGSAPRGTGSQMLTDGSRVLSGTVGGGVVEALAVRKTGELLRLKKGELKEYSLEDSSRETGMVCGGTVKLAFTYIAGDSSKWKAAAEEIIEAYADRRDIYLSIEAESCMPVISSPGNTDHAHLIPFCGILRDGTFIRKVPMQSRVIVFGGGHVGQAVVPVLSRLGFYTVLFDNRPEFVSRELFPDADELVLGDFEAPEKYTELREDDYYVIMTSGHEFDYQLENRLLRRRSSYIGVMGSRKKTAAVNAKLLKAGITEEELKRVHTPIGLDIGAETPAEIAISVAAELIQVRARNNSDMHS